MTGLLSIVLAGATVAPATPIDARAWFTSKQHSKTALAVANAGPVFYTIDVAPDGRAIRCTPRQPGDIDRRVCELVMKSARFGPAADDQGRPAFAVYEGVASFLLPGRTTRPDRAKLTIVDTLPDRIRAPAYARVAFLVDGTGAIGHCAATDGERSRFQQPVEALAPAACRQLASDYRPIAARNDAGEPVSSVQSATIRFVLRQGR